MDQSQVEVAEEQEEETYIRPSWRMTVLANRSCVFRSPNQSSSPVTRNSTVKAGFRTVFSFWPALKRPCGALRPRQPAEVVAVEAVDLAHVAQDAAAVADEDDQESTPTHATPE